MIIKEYKGKRPQLAEGVFVADYAVITGDVDIGEGSTVWFHAVLRGDVEVIRIGKRTNVQDAAIIHTSTDRSPTVIGNDVTIGHRAIVHGCTIEDEVLIGMGAIILDDAYVEKHVLVAAGAVVTEASRLESGWLYAGIPAKKIKPLSEEQIRSICESAQHYVENAHPYMK